MIIRTCKIAVILAWGVLLALLVRRDVLVQRLDDDLAALINRARHEQYYGIWQKERRVGYVLEQLTPAREKAFDLRQETRLFLRLFRRTREIRILFTARLNERLEPEHFRLTAESAPITFRAEGRIQNGRLDLLLDNGRTREHHALALARTPRLELNRRPWLLDENRAPGSRFRVTVFDPLRLQPKTALVIDHGPVKQLIRGRVYKLRRFTEEYAGFRTRLYLDDRGKIIKAELPAGFSLVAEPRFKATDLDREQAARLDDLLTLPGFFTEFVKPEEKRSHGTGTAH